MESFFHIEILRLCSASLEATFQHNPIIPRGQWKFSAEIQAIGFRNRIQFATRIWRNLKESCNKDDLAYRYTATIKLNPRALTINSLDPTLTSKNNREQMARTVLHWNASQQVKITSLNDVIINQHDVLSTTWENNIYSEIPQDTHENMSPVLIFKLDEINNIKLQDSVIDKYASDGISLDMKDIIISQTCNGRSASRLRKTQTVESSLCFEKLSRRMNIVNVFDLEDVNQGLLPIQSLGTIPNSPVSALSDVTTPNEIE